MASMGYIYLNSLSLIFNFFLIYDSNLQMVEHTCEYITLYRWSSVEYYLNNHFDLLQILELIFNPVPLN